MQYSYRYQVEVHRWEQRSPTETWSGRRIRGLQTLYERLYGQGTHFPQAGSDHRLRVENRAYVQNPNSRAPETPARGAARLPPAQEQRDVYWPERKIHAHRRLPQRALSAGHASRPAVIERSTVVVHQKNEPRGRRCSNIVVEVL